MKKQTKPTGPLLNLSIQLQSILDRNSTKLWKDWQPNDQKRAIAIREEITLNLRKIGEWPTSSSK